MFEMLEGAPELAGLVIKILDLPSVLRGAMTKKEAKASVTLARMEPAILAVMLGHVLRRENIR